MDIKKAFGVLLARWWIVAITVIIGIIAGIVATLLTTSQYTSNAQLFVSTTGGTSSTESYQGDQFSQQRATSYAQILTSEILGQRVSETLDLGLSGTEVASKVTATVVPKTVLLDVSVTDTDPTTAASIANTLSDEFIAYIVPLETPSGQEQARATVTIVNDAEPTTEPTSPKLTTNLIYGVAGGVLVGLILVALVAALDTRVKNRSSAETATGLPVLGPVKPTARSAEGRRAQLESWTSPDAEAYRKIRVHLQSIPSKPQVIVVTSSSAKENTSDFSLDLALAFAETDHPVLLIETDSANPALAAKVSATPGGVTLVDALSQNLGEQLSRETVTGTVNPAFWVMPVGSGPDIPPMLSAAPMREMVTVLRQHFTYIVIDTPPLTESGSAPVLAELSDGSLLVVDTKRARKKDVAAAVRELREADSRPIAAVMTESPRRR